MKNQKESIRKLVSCLNNTEEGGGFWLPNIQRKFVWHENQIERLFDSIMREYPISTLLVWRSQSRIKRRKFIDHYQAEHREAGRTYEPEDDRVKLLVLDGQQRLQSLFIGLKGSYEKRELHLDILSGDLAAPEDIRYRFRFLEYASASFPWMRFKDIVFSNEKPRDLRQRIKSKSVEPLTDAQSMRIEDNLDQIKEVFANKEVITYQELDSVDQPKLYTENDVVEIFIRANSGGTRLGKSDLLFSLLTSSWDVAEEQMDSLLETLNSGGYDFTRDFVLKACLTLQGKGSRYDISKFRDGETKEMIVDQWDTISDAIRDVRDFLYGKTFIRTDKALPSYLGLIPLIYFRFHFPQRWKQAKELDQYLLRTLMTGAFSGTPDNLIDRCVKRIRESQDFKAEEMFAIVRADNRALEITPSTLFDMSYGSREIHLLFNLWYRDFNYHPAYTANLPQVDHIFPQSLLRKEKVLNPATGRHDLLRYYADTRNQLANCMLLSAQENGAGGKTDTPPDEWFADKAEEYLDMHLIPRDKSLWKLDRFEEFLSERKKLITARFGYLLQNGSSF